MNNTVTLASINGDGVFEPEDSLTNVELYEWADEDPFYTQGSVIASISNGFITNEGGGVYVVSLTRSVKGTILVNGLPIAGYIGVPFFGDDISFIDV